MHKASLSNSLLCLGKRQYLAKNSENATPELRVRIYTGEKATQLLLYLLAVGKRRSSQFLTHEGIRKAQQCFSEFKLRLANAYGYTESIRIACTMRFFVQLAIWSVHLCRATSKMTKMRFAESPFTCGLHIERRKEIPVRYGGVGGFWVCTDKCQMIARYAQIS